MAAVDPPITLTAGAGHTGAMIALSPADPESLVRGSEGPNQLHVTLAYLGENDSLNDEQRSAILSYAETLSTAVPLKAKVLGPAFLNGNCTVLLCDSAELRQLHENVDTAIGSRSSFPGFIPHMTLDYGDSALEMDDFPEEVEFSRLWVSFGEEDHYFDGLQPGLTASPPIGNIMHGLKRVWDEALHPRGKDGRFIRVGSLVRGPMSFLTKNGDVEVRPSAVAKVVSITKDGKHLHLEDKLGRKGIAVVSQVTEAAAPKASLGRIPEAAPRETSAQRTARKIREMSEASLQLPESAEGRIPILNKLMGGLRGSPLTSVMEHNKRGASRDEWDDARVTQHEELWDAFMRKVKEAGIPRERSGVILGGQPGAGKSYSLRPGEPAGDLGVVGWEGDGTPPEGVTHIVVNPDVLKDLMIEEGMLPEWLPEQIRPREAVSIIHAESNFLSTLFMDRLSAGGYNIAYDSTMANVSHVQKNVRSMAENGYTFKGLYVKIPKEESLLSAKRRYVDESQLDPVLGGRFVPSEASSAWDTESTFRSFISWFTDGWMMVDNTGVSNGAPRKHVYGEGVGDGNALAHFLSPMPPKPQMQQGDPTQGEFWDWGQGSVPFEPPKKSSHGVMWQPGMKFPDSDIGGNAEGEPMMAAAVPDPDVRYVTDKQAVAGMYSGALTPDEYLDLLRNDLVLVSPETGDDPEDYLGASTVYHELLRSGRGGLAPDIASEVVRLRNHGMVHDD